MLGVAEHLVEHQMPRVVEGIGGDEQRSVVVASSTCSRRGRTDTNSPTRRNRCPPAYPWPPNGRLAGCSSSTPGTGPTARRRTRSASPGRRRPHRRARAGTQRYARERSGRPQRQRRQRFERTSRAPGGRRRRRGGRCERSSSAPHCRGDGASVLVLAAGAPSSSPEHAAPTMPSGDEHRRQSGGIGGCRMMIPLIGSGSGRSKGIGRVGENMSFGDHGVGAAVVVDVGAIEQSRTGQDRARCGNRNRPTSMLPRRRTVGMSRVVNPRPSHRRRPRSAPTGSNITADPQRIRPVSVNTARCALRPVRVGPVDSGNKSWIGCSLSGRRYATTGGRLPVPVTSPWARATSTCSIGIARSTDDGDVRRAVVVPRPEPASTSRRRARRRPRWARPTRRTTTDRRRSRPARHGSRPRRSIDEHLEHPAL